MKITSCDCFEERVPKKSNLINGKNFLGVEKNKDNTFNIEVQFCKPYRDIENFIYKTEELSNHGQYCQYCGKKIEVEDE